MSLELFLSRSRAEFELLEAFKHKYPEMLKSVVSRYKFNVNAQLSSGKYPIEIAVENAKIKHLATLDSLGANIKVVSNSGYNMMQTAAMYGHLEVIRSLLSMGVEMNKMEPKNLYTPLMLAIAWRQPKECVQEMIQLGADPKVISHEGYTALAFVILGRREDLLEFMPFSPHTHELVNRKKVGHFFGLARTSTIGHITFNLEGALSPYMHACIARTWSAFIRGRASIFSKRDGKAIGSVFQNMNESTVEEIFANLQANKPLLLAIKSYSHAIDLIFMNGYFVICNRGHKALNDRSIVAYKYEEGKLSLQILRSMFAHVHIPQFTKKLADYVYEEFPKIIVLNNNLEMAKDFTCDLLENLSPMKLTKIGSCSLACGKAALRVIGTLQKLRSTPLRYHCTVAKLVRQEYKKWSLFARMEVLQEYLDKHHIADAKSLRSSMGIDRGMVNAAWKKIKNKCAKHLMQLEWVHFEKKKVLSKILD